MNATNRIVNRLVLLLGGVLLAAAGAVAIVTGIRAGWAQDASTRVFAVAQGLVAPLESWRFQAADGTAIAGVVVAGLALAAVVGIAAVAFLVTRGGGRTADVLRADGPRGDTSVDRSVADAVIARVLARRPEVLSARTTAYRVRKTPTLAISLTVHRGARLDAVLDAVESAVREWDALLGRRIPVLVHLADARWRDAFRSPRRVR